MDRATAVRKALRRLVAARGFHGASMSAVAREAGVATGTAYVHYESKDALVLAAYGEVKREFSNAAAQAIDSSQPPEVRFGQLWLGAYRYLSKDPDLARFLIQVDASPYAQFVHPEPTEVSDDPLLAEVGRPDMQARLLPLPAELLYDLAVGPLLRLVASERTLDERSLLLVAEAGWRAISQPE